MVLRMLRYYQVISLEHEDGMMPFRSEGAIKNLTALCEVVGVENPEKCSGRKSSGFSLELIL
jgi:hypothetical protein